MGKIRQVYQYVELPTKIASVIPFFTALAYCFFLSGHINIRSSLLFFVAMLLFDMTTTMINNYIDLREAGKKGFFSRPVMLAMIFCAFFPASLIGLFLAWMHGPVFLLAGLFCFTIGILYTFGPMPISRSPYSELLSGLAMGFVLPFLVITINMPPLVLISFSGWDATATFDLLGLLRFGLVCAPLVFCISNIMLANNICDFEADRATRYTMPHHIGIKNSLRLFAVLYSLCYLVIIAACVLGLIPWSCLIVLLTVIPVFRNVKRFIGKQEKSETFILAIKNFLVLLVPYAAGLFIGSWFT